MSHIATIATEVRDPDAIRAACRRLGLPGPVLGSATLFEGPVAGWLVRLPGWAYPVACDVESGSVRFDNYAGAWGDRAHLDRFLQAYAVEKAGIEARRRGHVVSERTLSDGSILVTVEVGGVA